MASMVEPNQFGLTFSTCYGVASLHVGRLLDLGIKVISDPEDPSKLLLANVPFENPGEPQLEKLAGDIAKSARIVEVFNPPLENKRNG